MRARGRCGEVLEACAFRCSVTAFPGDFAACGGAPGPRAGAAACAVLQRQPRLCLLQRLLADADGVLPSRGGAASAGRAGGRGSGRVMRVVRGNVARTGTAHQWGHGFTGAAEVRTRARFVPPRRRRRLAVVGEA
ncbi:hypothetical protein PAHAL_9G615300 [Panicum hallii]|jgi:hypothetical protein|uniref:Uncharacterized protein n=1 Tax=Panicum hallii TaxID=206008 RepID=A0A2T8I6J0_9POAL|nr:hypothetical protein PAHAL_9G615300 [Panicum hallii]